MRLIVYNNTMLSGIAFQINDRREIHPMSTNYRYLRTRSP